MSLRARLLLAVGAVALVALLAADVATYYSLRSSLFGRVDQTLAVIQHAVDRVVIGGPSVAPPGSTGAGRGRHGRRPVRATTRRRARSCPTR